MKFRKIPFCVLKVLKNKKDISVIKPFKNTKTAENWPRNFCSKGRGQLWRWVWLNGGLGTEMGESAVGFGHLMGVFAFFHSIAFAL